MNLPRLPPKEIRGWLLLGLAIREALSFWTGHPFDMEVWVRNAYYVARGVSPYSYMAPVPGLSMAYLGQSLPSVGYLPLWSMLLALLYGLFSLLPGGNRFVLYFLVKQPSVLGDALLGCALFAAVRRWGGTPERARAAFRFWMLFPYPILISAVWGQFDALVAFVWILSLLAPRPARRSVLEGLGILLKLFPVIFLPYHVLRDRGAEKARAALTLAVPLGFSAAALAAMGWGLGNFNGTMVAQAHGSPLGLTVAAVLFSTQAVAAWPALQAVAAVYAWLWVPAVLAACVVAARRFGDPSPASLVQAMLLVTAAFFLLHTQVYEQYLLYLLPVLLLDVVLWHPERRALFHMTWALGLAFLLLNNDFLVRFVVPVAPSVLGLTEAWDATPLYGSARDYAMWALALLFAAHLVQLSLVVLRPAADPTPWLLRPFVRLRALAASKGAAREAIR